MGKQDWTVVAEVERFFLLLFYMRLRLIIIFIMDWSADFFCLVTLFSL